MDNDLHKKLKEDLSGIADLVPEDNPNKHVLLMMVRRNMVSYYLKGFSECAQSIENEG